MKKTLIALLALGSVAMAADNASKILTYTTDTTGVSSNKGNYTGIAFTLSDNARLNVSEDVTTATDAFTLTSIQVQTRADKGAWGNNACMYIIDEDKTLIAASNYVTADVDAGEYVTFEFGETTNILASGKANKNQALTLGNTYYAYFGDKNQMGSWYIGVYAGIGDTLTYLNASSRGIAVAGTYQEASASDATMVKIANDLPVLDSTTYAPMIKISGTVNQAVPEPATSSLSLLALAGLCARRRKK